MKQIKHLGLASAIFSLMPCTLWADPIDIRIFSNSSWRSSDSYQSDWEKSGFDDSAWSQARAPYPTPGWQPTDLIPGTHAQTMWHDPQGTSTGTTGVTEAFFRTTFNLDIASDSLPLSGGAIVFVDDDFDFYVNGTLAYRDHTPGGGGADVRHYVDFTPLLHSGENTFAIHAWDGEWGNPYDRVYEMVLVDAFVRSQSVPEPSALALLGLGMAGIAGVRRRFTIA